MNGDGKFWVACWSLAAGVVCTLIVSIAASTAYKANVLRDMVSSQHADPMRASCALDIGERTQGVCSILASTPVR